MQRRKKKQEMGLFENGFVILIISVVIFELMYFGYLLFSHI